MWEEPRSVIPIYPPYNTATTVAIRASKRQWASGISISEVREMVSSHAYYQGTQIYNEGGITEIKLIKDFIVARLESDMGGPATVSVTADKLQGESHCQCIEYMTPWDGPCMHVAAVLIYAAKHMGKLLDDALKRRDAIQYLLPSVSEKDIREYVGTLLENLPSEYDRFVKKFNLDDARIPRDHSAIMATLYAPVLSYGESRGGNVDFGAILEVARNARDGDLHGEATKAYQAMSDAITNNMSMVNDTTYYGDFLTESIDSMVDSIVREELPHDQKRPHISYFFDRCVGDRYTKHRRQYMEALSDICYTAEDMSYWEDLLQQFAAKHAPAPHLTLMECCILKETGRDDKAMSLLAEHYRKDRELCLQYVGMLREADAVVPDDIRKVLDAFPEDPEIIREALPLYDMSSPQYAHMLRRLFMITGEWDWFAQLKKAATDWGGTLESMVKDLRKSSPGRVVEMYLKDGRPADAMTAAESADDIGVYFKYAPKLGKKYPERYFEAYSSRIRKFAKGRTGEAHYSRVCEHIKRIQGIPGTGERADRLVAKVKSENSGRSLLRRMLIKFHGGGSPF